jgi:FixJ family two-component response regulator
MALPPKVFVIDDEPLVVRLLERLLTGAGFDVEGYSSADAFLVRPQYQGPTCVVVDQVMPGCTGLQLAEMLPSGTAQVVFISGQSTPEMAVKAMRSGAVDFLPKPIDLERLVGVVRHALVRSVSEVEAASAQRHVAERWATLTPREREVCLLMVKGLLNRQIAAQLGATEKAIKVHRQRVFKKLEAGSVAEIGRLIGLIQARSSDLRH